MAESGPRCHEPIRDLGRRGTVLRERWCGLTSYGYCETHRRWLCSIHFRNRHQTCDVRINR